MTTLRNDAKNEIIKILREQGYPTYAKLVNLFDIYLTDDPEVIGYMVPGEAKIVLNEKLSINQVSTIVRHELLHEWLTHAQRRAAVDAEDNDMGDHEIANIAADYEISNKGYTDADKRIARSIILGDQVLRGLVTEDQYPDWENKSFEEMYRELRKEQKENEEKLKKLIQQLSKLNKKDLDDLKKQLNQASGQSQGQPQPGQVSGSGGEEDDQQEKGSGSGQKDGNDGQTVDQKKASQFSDEVEDIQNELDQNSSGGGGSSGENKPTDKGGSNDNTKVFDTPEEQARKADLAKRIAEIKKIFQDSGLKDKALGDSRAVINRERAARRAASADRAIQSPLSRFRISLDKFISDQISQDEVETYEIQNPSYEDEEFLEPAIMVKEEKFIPKINVYWDVSGSFSSPQKTEGARKAIATLNRYVRDGDIEIDTFYFADRVSETIRGAGGGTNGKPIQDHITKTKPTNVIIITDSDISDCTSMTVVPGAVWILFYDSESNNLKQHIRGKRETRHYLVTNY